MALLLERSELAVTAILAVLKTGAAYVPIDPTVPGPRRDFVLTDAAPCVVLTSTALRGLLRRTKVACVRFPGKPACSSCLATDARWSMC